MLKQHIPFHAEQGKQHSAHLNTVFSTAAAVLRDVLVDILYISVLYVTMDRLLKTANKSIIRWDRCAIWA